MNTTIIEITPAEAFALQREGVRLIDVREPEEHVLGIPAGALAASRAQLEAVPDEFHPLRAESLILICSGGGRSSLAAQTLSAQGYLQLYSVIGGFQRWQAEGFPVDVSNDESAEFTERYSRHLCLPQIGLAGQKKLAQARVLMVGAGGLGSSAAFYLAAAGVGFLRIVDDDKIERSNLQRQILHTDARIGQSKVGSAQQTLSALNPRVNIETHAVRVNAENVENLIQDVDIVVDGADNFPTRYLLSDACVHLRKPLVYGAVHRFEGQVSVFDAGRQRGQAPCYRCLFPQAPSAAEAPNCTAAGVLGVLPGIIGLLQATETIKLILGIGTSLSGRLLHIETLAMNFRETRLAPDPACLVCRPGQEFMGYSDEIWNCAHPSDNMSRNQARQGKSS